MIWKISLRNGCVQAFCGVTLFGVVNVYGATIQKISIPKRNFIVHRVSLAFQIPSMTSGKSIQAPTFQRIGGLLGDTITFKAELDPAISLPDSDYAWSGSQTGNGQTVSVVLSRVGPNSETLTVGSKSLNAVASVYDVQPPNQDQWAATHPIAAAAIYFSLKTSAENWAATANTANNWGDPLLHNGRADAARHAYWNVLMAFSGFVGPSLAQEAGFAHERTNLEESASTPHNETAMDLTNNQGGLTIAAGLPANATEAQMQNAVVNTIAADGPLVILDDLGNSPPSGLLQPSNR